MLALSSLAIEGDPAGAYVTDGTLKTSHVTLANTSCAVLMTGGSVTLTDSAIDQSGVVGSTNCVALPGSPDAVAVTVNGGDLSMRGRA